MPKVFFHETYEWNLLHIALIEGLLPWSGKSAYVRHQIDEGLRSGWINSDNQRRALEMLVFADAVVAPAVDVKPEGALFAEGHVVMDNMPWHEAHPSREEVARNIRELLPWLSRNIQLANPHVRTEDLLSGLAYLESSAQWEGAFPSLDTLRDQVNTTNSDDLFENIERVFDDLYRNKPTPPPKPTDRLLIHEVQFFRRAQQWAADGVPALALPSAELAPGQPASLATAESGAISYFFWGVPIPSPRTIKEALIMRKNPNIQSWRERISDWAQLLIEDPEHAPARIREQIATSKGVLNRVPHREIPSWTIIVVGPLEVLAAVHGIPGVFGFSSLATDVFNRVLNAFSKAEETRGQKHRWIMIGS